MKLYVLEPNVIEVVHPGDPDLKVRLREPEILTGIRYKEQAEAWQTQSEKFEGYLGFVAEHVDSIEGLVGLDGAPIVLKAPITIKQLMPFTRPEFDVEIEEDVPVRNEKGEFTGEMHREMVKKWFATHLANVLMEPETFSRPLALAATPSTNSTSGS